MSRAYTKSGSTEKYESNEWSTPSWSNTSNKGTITGPDSNGNYTVNAPSGYAEGTSSDYSVTCTTKYGGVSKTFYFKESISYYINVGTTVKNELLPSGNEKKTFIIYTSWVIPADATITVSATIQYNVIDAATGLASSARYNFSQTCTGGGDFVEKTIATDSSSKGKEYQVKNVNNAKTSNNVYGIEADWSGVN